MATKAFVVRNSSTFAPEPGVTVTHEAVGGFVVGVTDGAGSVTLTSVGLPASGGTALLEKAGFLSDVREVFHGVDSTIVPGSGWGRGTSAPPVALPDIALNRLNAITSNLEASGVFDFDITYTDLVFGTGGYTFTGDLRNPPTNPWPSPGSVPQSYFSWVLTVRTDLDPGPGHPPTPQTVYGLAYYGTDVAINNRVFVTFNADQVPPLPPDPDPVGDEQPFNLRSHFGWYYRAFISSGLPKVSRARARPQPPFDQTSTVHGTATAARPVLAEDGRERLWCLWERDTTVYAASSDDDAATWADPVSLFTGGKHPIVRQDPVSGALLAAAFVSPNIQTRIRYPGQSDFQAAATLEEAAGAIAVEDEAFGMEWMGDGQGRVVFAARRSGETAITEFVSFDDGVTCEEVA